FSKPPLTMWMDLPGLWLTGAQYGFHELSRMTEWSLRVPYTLTAIATLSLFAYAIYRTASARVALVTVFVLGTMPLYFLLARQVVTDTPFVCTQVAAMSCALIGLFDKDTRKRTAWWYAFWILLGLGTLAKELLAVAIPAAVLLLYAALC